MTARVSPVDAADWLQVKGGHTLASLFAIPAPTLQDDDYPDRVISVGLQLSNEFAGGRNPDETLLLDGERTELRLSGLWPLSLCRHVEADLSLIHLSGGFLDNTIHRWHQFFGLPLNNRGEFPRNQLDVSYDNNGVQVLSLRQSSTGFGDVTLAYGWRPGCRQTGFRGGVVLPVGGQDWPRSTGETRWFADIDSGRLRHGGSWRSRHALGLMLIEDSALFDNERAWALYGANALQYVWRSQWRAAFQLDWHTALFDSNLAELGRLTTQLSLAVQYVPGRRWQLDVGFREDLPPDSAPDFTVFSVVRNHF